MDSAGPTATIEVHNIVAGNEPLGQTVALILRIDGFHDTDGVGSSGEMLAPLPVEQVAEVLLAHFGRNDLDRLFSHITELRSALMRQPD
ncbi:MAG: hypothetical protein WB615_13750 [Candidatus Tumulicola sp.]